MGESLLRTSNRIDPGVAGIGTSKRALILHDSFTFLVLGLVTLGLFGVTLFLFRSFEGHRTQLAKDYLNEGRAELNQGQPADAVKSLRAALAYEPDNYSSQLMLAQALADAGETDQATNYFMNLWEVRPGDGFLNLQLAKLERRKGNRADAIRYYRDSIFGDWPGDATNKRRDVRLELVDYLAEGKNIPAATIELLIAASNAPDSLELNLLFANKLRAIGDVSDSLTYFQKAIADDPHNTVALQNAGELLYADGHFSEAQRLLERAVGETSKPTEELLALTHDSHRIQQLSFARELPAAERERHLLEDAKTAQARFTKCFVNGHEGMTSATYGTGHQQMLASLTKSWMDATETARRKMVQTAVGQDELAQLVVETELFASDDPMANPQFSCGPPKGDDALLVRLARGWKSEQ